MKIFISYSHVDETSLKQILDLECLKKFNSTTWYDRKMNGGDEWNETIEYELNEADVIIMLMSPAYLASNACTKERETAKKLNEEKGIKIISIILEDCKWKEIDWLSSKLAIPTDGKPMTFYTTPADYFSDVDKWLCKTFDEILLRKSLSNSEQFSEFLNSTDILTNSHYTVRTLHLFDIFIFPPIEQSQKDRDFKRLDRDEFFKSFFTKNKIVIKGANQSGKTSLCKDINRELLTRNFVPVYIDCDKFKEGTPEQIISQNFKTQYSNENFDNINKKYIVPICDNFYNIDKKERFINYLKKFNKSIIIIDDVYDLTLNSQNILRDYEFYRIKPFNPVKRNELLQLWIGLDENFKVKSPVEQQRELDHYDNMLEATLGKVFGKGIIPAYPFFVLSILSSFFSAKPIDQDITTQGYCYQSLIYFYLRKYGATNEIIDAIINFLSELSYSIYQTKKEGLMEDKFQDFIKRYRERFNLPITDTELLKMLRETNMAGYDSVFNFSFTYNYIYYFFIAKYFADNIKDKHIQNEIKIMSESLYIEKNAMIVIFIGHHSKSDILLDELILQSQYLFEGSLEATLSKNELDFFDKNEKLIIDAVLPAVNENIAENRKKLLEKRSDKEDEENKTDSNSHDSNLSGSTTLEDIQFLNQIRLAFRTGEVLGTIIKNRAGSLAKDKIIMIYDSIFRMYMRLSGSFIELIRNEELEADFIKFLIFQTTEKIVEERKISKSESEVVTRNHIEKLAKSLYWNLNFSVIYSLIHRTISSLGSSYLLDISDIYKNSNSSTASLVTHYGIRMQFAKNLDIEEGEKFLLDIKNSYTSKSILKQLVANYCKYNKVEDRKLHAIESKLHISKRKILIDYEKEHRRKK